MVVSTRTHVYIGFANPFLICNECKAKVKYWHDPTRCGCDDGIFNYPCKHKAGADSRCVSWGPVDGCRCQDRHTK